MAESPSKKQKLGFGSFHSGNVEEMLADAGWQPPEDPHDVASSDDLASMDIQFGHRSRSLFLLDEDWTFVNHGAFGAPLKSAYEAANRWRLHTERQPLRFVDRELFPHMVKTIKAFAAHIGCSPSDVVLVPNATTALNAVFNSLPLTSSDSIFYLDCTYNSVKKMIKSACERTGAMHVQKILPFPLPKGTERAAIIAAVEEGIPEGCKYAVFDHITSNEGLLMPVQELVEVCHKKGVIVLIDGAHGLGSQLGFSPATYKCEYYVGNCHKWFSSPRGAGFLYVDHKRLATIAPAETSNGKESKPAMVCSDKTCERGGPDVKMVWGSVRQPIISHGYGQGFASEFIWDGARDYSQALSIPACINFWERVGQANALGYAKALLTYAVGKMAARWGTEPLFPENMCATMALIRLPEEAKGISPALGDAARMLQDRLHMEQAVECPAKVVSGALYLRLSAWIYNEPKDYLRVAQAVEKIIGASAGQGGWEASVAGDWEALSAQHKARATTAANC